MQRERIKTFPKYLCIIIAMSILNVYVIELRNSSRFSNKEGIKVFYHNWTFITLQLVTTLRYIYFFTLGITNVQIFWKVLTSLTYYFYIEPSGYCITLFPSRLV